MNPEGRVIVDMRDAAAPSVRFERPGDVVRVLKGKTRDEAIRIVPMIYSICGLAQVHAASCALDAASGNRVGLRTDLARQALVGMESLREQLLRIMLDWPGFSGETPRAHDAAPVMQFTSRIRAALFDGDPFAADAAPLEDTRAALEVIDQAEALLVDLVFGQDVESWLSLRGRDGLMDWAQRCNTVAGTFIGGLILAGEADLAEVVPLADINAVWMTGNGRFAGLDQALASLADGKTAGVAETTLYSRLRQNPLLQSMGGNGLLVRHLARLVELAQLPERMRKLVAGTGAASEAGHEERDGVSRGWSRIEAARGTLVHAVSLRDGRIESYSILPPTLWNFHSEGVARLCLSRIGRTAPERTERLSRLVVNAVDPCVGYELRVA